VTCCEKWSGLLARRSTCCQRMEEYLSSRRPSLRAGSTRGDPARRRAIGRWHPERVLRLVAQPFDDMEALHGHLVDVLGDTRVRHFYAVTAWAKRSGLARIAADLVAYRRRGGISALIVGIDEGGATRQGLRLALDLFDRVHILHDRGGRIFHPKLYLAKGRRIVRAYVGSGNLTAGGLYGNYELGFNFTFEEGDPDYRNVREGLARYVARLYRDPDTCRQLTRTNVEAVIRDPAYRVGDEDRRRPLPEIDASPDVGPPERGRNVLGFRPSRSRMRRAPATSGRTPASRVVPTEARRRTRSRTVARGTVERWFKRMSASDAQRARPGSNPTGNLRLAQAGHDIDHTTYFRHVFFGGEAWTKEPAPNGVLDVVKIQFDVQAEARSLGRHRLRVDHADFRVAGQRNIATFLHWGTLTAELRRRNYTNRYVVLERMRNGRYRLVLRRTPPGLRM
jgi:HKD family nuclease